ncbi:MAG: flagellar biosynthetic protein FliO [Hyphomicrobium sp.]
MLEILSWLAIIVVIAGLGAGAAFVARGGSASDLTRGFFGPRPEPRVEVVEYAPMDGKRRLVLIRRDDVEHLLLTGGPVDVVIETGIGIPLLRPADAQPAQAAAVVTRPARGFGHRSLDAANAPPALNRAAPQVFRAQEPELSGPDPVEARVERG